MIRAEGVVRFLRNDGDQYKTGDVVFQTKNLYVEVVSVNRIEAYRSFELACTYKVNIEEKYYCSEPNDYVGQVYPILKRNIERILMTQVVYIDYIYHDFNLVEHK